MTKEENPLYYFENILRRTQNQVKTKYMTEAVDNGGGISRYDYEKGEIEFYYSFYDEQKNQSVEGFEMYSFKDFLKKEMYRKGNEAYSLFRRDKLLIAKNGKTSLFYIQEIQNRITELLKLAEVNFPDYPFVKEVLLKLKSITSDNKPIKTSAPIDIEDYCEDSFDWNKIKQEDKILFVKKMYQLLMENSPIISASEEDFINAFTQKKVDNGIKWLLKSKNGKTSKTSLFYFIDELRNNNLLTYFEEYSFGRKVEYVFRDCDGNPFSNISQSLNYYRERKSCDNEETIDNIIFQLEQP